MPRDDDAQLLSAHLVTTPHPGRRVSAVVVLVLLAMLGFGLGIGLASGG